VSQRVLTIGVYGFKSDRFFSALENAGADVFLDIRQRRGVRGSRYAFANVGRLSAELERRGIAGPREPQGERLLGEVAAATLDGEKSTEFADELGVRESSG
jgi:hypothetical protein